jgi:rod shape-determining protein MreC
MPGSFHDSSLSADAGGRVARLMFYIMAAVVLMVLDHRGGHVEKIRSTAALAVEPMQVLIESPFRFGRAVHEQFRDRRALLAERTELERLLRESHARLILLEEKGRENAELRELLGASESLVVDFQTAELRQIDLNPYSHRILINRGRRHGIAAGQPVIDARGVVGQIDEAMLHSAQVILLSDPDHALPVSVARTRLRTIAYGSGRTTELRLTDLPMNVDLEPGDVLLTSGLGGRFPAGLPVAEVTDVARPAGEAFAVATARPMARLDGARHLLVLAASEREGPAVPPGDDLDPFESEGLVDDAAEIETGPEPQGDPEDGGEP